MAEKTVVDKAGETVGVALAMGCSSAILHPSRHKCKINFRMAHNLTRDPKSSMAVTCASLFDIPPKTLIPVRS
jgi:hypothetical protein